jgi:hypothetical protein
MHAERVLGRYGDVFACAASCGGTGSILFSRM